MKRRRGEASSSCTAAAAPVVASAPVASGGGAGAGASLRAAIIDLPQQKSHHASSGAEVRDALLALLQRGEGQELGADALSALRGGVDALAQRDAELRLVRVRGREAQHLATLDVVVRGVQLPAALCVAVAHHLGNAGRCRLGAASRDWRAVVASPEAWPALELPAVKMLGDAVVALLCRPQFAHLRQLACPEMTTKKGVFKALLRACPGLVSLDMRRISGGLKPNVAAELVAHAPSPRSLRIIMADNNHHPINAPMLARFTQLRALSAVWWLKDYTGVPAMSAAQLPAIFRAVGGLAQLRFLSLRQRYYTKGDWLSLYALVDDAVMAPVAQGCTRLRHLELGNFFGVGPPTWRLFRQHAPHLASVVLGIGDAAEFAAVPDGWLGTCVPDIVALPALTAVAITASSDGRRTRGMLLAKVVGLAGSGDLARWQLKDAQLHRLVLPKDIVDAMPNPKERQLPAGVTVFSQPSTSSHVNAVERFLQEESWPDNNPLCF